MNRLSITTAWNETLPFLKTNFGPLLLIILAFQIIPSVALQFLVPLPFAPGAMEPGSVPPDEMLAALGRVSPFIVLIGLVSLTGTLAVMALVLGHGETVGDAIAAGFRRLLPFLGAWLLFCLALILATVPLVALAALLGTAGGAGTALGIVIAILILPLFIFAMVRMLLLTPVAVAEPLGPVAMLRRSWELTSGHFWKLLGFVLLLALVFIVLSLAVTAVIGGVLAVALGAPEQGSLSQLLLLLLGGAVNAAFTTVYLTMTAKIYTQLSPTDVGTVFD